MLIKSIRGIARGHLPGVQFCRCRLRVTDGGVAFSKKIMLRLPARVGRCCLIVKNHRSTSERGPERMFWSRECTEERPMRLSAAAIEPRNTFGLELRFLRIWTICGYEGWLIGRIHVRARTCFTNRSYHDGG